MLAFFEKKGRGQFSPHKQHIFATSYLNLNQNLLKIYVTNQTEAVIQYLKHLKQVKQRKKNIIGTTWLELRWIILLDILSKLATTKPILVCV